MKGALKVLILDYSAAAFAVLDGSWFMGQYCLILG